DQADERRLASAIGADECPNLTLLQGKIHAVDGLEAAERTAQIAGFEQWRHGSHRSHFARIVPTMPLGKYRISKMSVTTTTSIWAVVCLEATSIRSKMISVPMKRPSTVAAPPSSTHRRGRIEYWIDAKPEPA